jgi:hypothetical protein
MIINRKAKITQLARIRRKEKFYTLLVGTYISTAIMPNTMEGPKQTNKKYHLKMELLYDEENPLLGIYPKEMKSEAGRDIWAPMLIAITDESLMNK